MATQPLSPLGLQLQLEEKPNETIVHCKGKIIAENSEVFQSEIRDLIPESRAQIAATTYRIVLDLSNVTHVDSTGLGALLGAWTAAQSKGCDLEIANLNPRVEKLVEITKLDTVFKRARLVAAGSTEATPAVVDMPPALRFRYSRLKEAALFAGGRYGISIGFGLEVVEAAAWRHLTARRRLVLFLWVQVELIC